MDDRGRGFLRNRERHFEPARGEPVIDAGTVRRLHLRPGSEIVLEAGRVASVDGLDPDAASELPSFKLLTTIDPVERHVLEAPGGDLSLRVIDLICPLGRGSRAPVVAPPRSGKTVLLEKIATRIASGYPETALLVLLVNERPEEATHFRRTVTRGEVYYSTVDEPDVRHVHITEMVGARARRLVELGRDVVLDRDLTDRRVFSAIDVQRSGTRREERLVPPEVLRGMHTLRKLLLKMMPSEATPLLLQKLALTPSNAEFLAKFSGDGGD